MPNEHSGHRSRLRDRVRKEGLENFYDYQALEYALTFVIPYKDTNMLAHRLINKFGSFYGVLEADEEELQSVEGMGEVSAHFLANLLKIYHYYEFDKSKRVTVLSRPEETFNYVKQLFHGKLIEEVYIICFTPKNKIIAVEKIAEGTISTVDAPIRKISDKLSRLKCSNIILAHNHPGGKVEPSEDDHRFTKAIVTTLALTGSHLMDHIIVGEGEEYYSYRRSGLIDEYKESIKNLLVGKVAQPQAKYEVD